MKITFTATNPCHMWPTARAIAVEGVPGAFHSGYPAWKLGNTSGVAVRSHNLRTNIVYGLLKYAPAWLRPSSRVLFTWQDRGFDRSASRALEPCDFVHAMPGQALATFRAAKRLGIRTVLNHATGPVRAWVNIMRPEYERVGLQLENVCPYNAEYFAREDEEYALADFHCAASTVVRDQLLTLGIARERVWVVPYGADTRERVFFREENAEPPREFRILFAGQIGIRKGIATLLEALAIAQRKDWSVDFIGQRLPECDTDFSRLTSHVSHLTFHGPQPQHVLAKAMRAASVLVLPSIEEGFGLVIPQAMNCGCPCIVSDRVGAKDIVRHRDNGSIFPVRDAAALAAELSWWAEHPRRISENFTWTPGARTLIAASTAALA